MKTITLYLVKTNENATLDDEKLYLNDCKQNMSIYCRKRRLVQTGTYCLKQIPNHLQTPKPVEGNKPTAVELKTRALVYSASSRLEDEEEKFTNLIPSKKSVKSL